MAATLDARVRLDSSQYSGAMSRIVRETNATVGKLSAQFGSLKNIFAGGLLGSFAASWVGGLMEAAMQAEKLEAALSATTGSRSIGESQFKQVKQLAGEIGLGIQEAAKAMIQFQSAGMSSAQAMETIKAGYNAILSSGGGANEFSRFAVAIQQLRASPKPLQEELNQLRESLPTTAKLMQEAFGAQRAEDLQKLGISGREFVDGFLGAMERLPAIGDTMEKQIGRFKQQLTDLKAELGKGAMPGASFGMGLITGVIQGTQAIADDAADALARAMGYDVESMNRRELARKEDMEAHEARKKAMAEAAAQADKDAASKNKSIEQGKTLAQVFGKFNEIILDTAKSSRELAAALDFEDRMQAFVDQERGNDWEAAADATRRQLSDAIMAKREAAGEAFNEFVGPQQMSDEERDAWRQRVDAQSMTREDRRAMRAQDREERRNTRKAADEQTRKELREAKEEARRNAFDDLKKNRGFFNEEQTKAKLRDQNRKAAKEAVENSAKTLTDIRDILKTLATA